MTPRINAIVAVCDNMGIGVNGKLPWKLNSEISFFKRMTINTCDPDKKNVVIMGRRTWESIPPKFRPLPGRVNIILSTTLKNNDVPEEVSVYPSLELVMRALLETPLSQQIETAWIIGGSSLYQKALSFEEFHRVYLTRIHQKFECDTFLNCFDEKSFKIVEDPVVPQETQEENGVKFSYIVYEKVRTSIGYL